MAKKSKPSKEKKLKKDEKKYQTNLKKIEKMVSKKQVNFKKLGEVLAKEMPNLEERLAYLRGIVNNSENTVNNPEGKDKITETKGELESAKRELEQIEKILEKIQQIPELRTMMDQELSKEHKKQFEEKCEEKKKLEKQRETIEKPMGILAILEKFDEKDFDKLKEFAKKLDALERIEPGTEKYAKLEEDINNSSNEILDLLNQGGGNYTLEDLKDILKVIKKTQR